MTVSQVSPWPLTMRPSHTIVNGQMINEKRWYEEQLAHEAQREKRSQQVACIDHQQTPALTQLATGSEQIVTTAAVQPKGFDNEAAQRQEPTPQTAVGANEASAKARTAFDYCFCCACQKVVEVSERSDAGCPECSRARSQSERSLTERDEEAHEAPGMMAKPAHQHCHECDAVPRYTSSTCPCCSESVGPGSVGKCSVTPKGLSLTLADPASLKDTEATGRPQRVPNKRDRFKARRQEAQQMREAHGVAAAQLLWQSHDSRKVQLSCDAAVKVMKARWATHKAENNDWWSQLDALQLEKQARACQKQDDGSQEVKLTPAQAKPTHLFTAKAGKRRPCTITGQEKGIVTIKLTMDGTVRLTTPEKLIAYSEALADQSHRSDSKTELQQRSDEELEAQAKSLLCTVTRLGAETAALPRSARVERAPLKRRMESAEVKLDAVITKINARKMALKAQREERKMQQRIKITTAIAKAAKALQPPELIDAMVKELAEHENVPKQLRYKWRLAAPTLHKPKVGLKAVIAENAAATKTKFAKEVAAAATRLSEQWHADAVQVIEKLKSQYWAAYKWASRAQDADREQRTYRACLLSDLEHARKARHETIYRLVLSPPPADSIYARGTPIDDASHAWWFQE